MLVVYLVSFILIKVFVTKTLYLNNLQIIINLHVIMQFRNYQSQRLKSIFMILKKQWDLKIKLIFLFLKYEVHIHIIYGRPQ